MTGKTTFLGVLGLCAVGLGGAGCQYEAQARAITAGYAPCSADEIVTANERFRDFAEWDAWCKGEQWHCAGTGPVINCRRVEGEHREPVASSSVQESAAPTAVTEAPKPPQPKPTWVTYESGACGVSARFPKPPVVSKEDANVPGGAITVEEAVYDRPDGSGTMRLGCASAGKATMSSVRVLDGARNGMIAAAKGKLVEEKAVVGGREVRFRVDDHDALARLLIAGDKVLIALVMPVDAFPEKSTKHFLDSVRSL